MADPFGMEADPQAQALAMAQLLRGGQQEDDDARRRLAQQRGFGNLGVLTGDPVLTRLGQGMVSQAQQQQPLEMRGAALRQGVARLALQSEAEKRRAEQGARQMALREELGRGGLAVQRARLADAKAQREEKKGEKSLELETGLRKEFNALPEVKEFSGIATSYSNLLEAAKDSSGAGGISTIFNFMKMLDPGVAVMEGDVQLIRAAGGPAAKYANLYEQALTGNPLPEKVRNDLVRQATSIYGTRERQLARLRDQYLGIAERAGAAPERVLIERAPRVQRPGSQPAPAASSRTGQTAAPVLTPEDAAALKWAQSNPNDQRAARILERLRVKGVQ